MQKNQKKIIVFISKKVDRINFPIKKAQFQFLSKLRLNIISFSVFITGLRRMLLQIRNMYKYENLAILRFIFYKKISFQS